MDKPKVLVTGAGKGIGFETVKCFLDQGYKVIAISRNTLQLTELANNSEELVLIQGDLTKEYAKVIEQIKAITNDLGIMVNNAGLLVNKPIKDLTDNDLSNMIEINLGVPFRMVRDLSNLFGTGSHIINIGSMGGVQGSAKFTGLSLYSASKGALAILTECMAEEFKDRKISVNCLALGAVNTEMLKEAFPEYSANLNPDEMARYIFDFSINGSKYFNGKIIPVSNSVP